MKFFSILLISFFVFGCKNHSGKVSFNEIQSNTDTIDVKARFIELIHFLNDPYPVEPDLAYEKAIDNCSGYSDVVTYIDSEAGKDDFYKCYFEFLKIKNGVDQEEKREKLISIYSSLNRINSMIRDGGTYFGHMDYRIPAYAEYSVYISIDNDYFEKQYSIENQKKLFIESIEQHISDDESVNFNYLPKEKEGRKKDFDNQVKKLDSLITDYFYLRMAQEFNYSHYK